MKSVSTRLDDETYRLIAETADERDVSKAEVLRELVEKGICPRQPRSRVTARGHSFPARNAPRSGLVSTYAYEGIGNKPI